MRRFAILGALLAIGCGSEELPEPREEPLDDYALAAPVEIAVDDTGVPHVYAESDLDAFFAQGYLEARDSLFALDVTRRSALGTLAEVAGEEFLESDVQARTFEFARWGEASVELLARERPSAHNAVVAYVAGVNRRIAEVDADPTLLPDDFVARGFQPEAWTPRDVLATGVRIQFGFSHTLSFDLLNTLVDALVDNRDAIPVFRPYGGTFFMQPAPLADVVPAPSAKVGAISESEVRKLSVALASLYANHGIGEGSNNWVVSGAHTENGRPWLANDSHAGLTSPNRMHLAHLSSAEAAGTLDVVGFSFLGVPAVHVGHNARVAWGATTNFADVMDVWRVSVDGGDVVLGGERLPFETRTETLRVRLADGSVREDSLELRSVPGFGILLSDAVLPVPKALLGGGELLLGWPGFAPTDELAQFLGFDRARSRDDFADAVDLGRTGMQNWVFADAEGIALRSRGLVPDRGPVAGRPRANAILDGSDPSTRWTGALLPSDRLPTLDGSEAFIVTANNDPWGHTADNDPLNDEFYYGSFFSPGMRAERATDWLAARVPSGAITREEMEVLAIDVTSTLAEELVPRIADAVGAIGTDPSLAAFENRPELAEAASRLSAWDKRMLRSSEEAALFRLFAALLSRASLEPALGALFDGLDEAQPVTVQKITLLLHTAGTADVLGQNARVLLVTALSEALAEHALRRGSAASYTWGDLHRAVFRGMIDGETLLPSDGDDSSLNVAQSRCWQDGALAEHCRSTAGAVYRIVVGFEDDGTPRATFATPMSNAGSTDEWIDGSFRPLHFRSEDVQAATAETWTLSPIP